MGINGSEFLVLVLVVLLVAGPEKLPEFAAQLGRLTREVKRIATGARERVRTELGPEFEDVDLSVFDPRQYDPRRIVRDALMEDEPPAPRPRPRADRRGTTAPRTGSTAAPAWQSPPAQVGADTPATPGVPASAPQAATPEGAPRSTATTAAVAPPALPAGGATPAPRDPAPATAAPLSPREIVARTRGLRPAGESAAVVAALAPLGVTAEEAAASAASASGTGSAAAQSVVPPRPDGAPATTARDLMSTWGTPEPLPAAPGEAVSDGRAAAVPSLSGEDGGGAPRHAPAYRVPFDDEAT